MHATVGAPDGALLTSVSPWLWTHSIQSRKHSDNTVFLSAVSHIENPVPVTL